VNLTVAVILDTLAILVLAAWIAASFRWARKDGSVRIPRKAGLQPPIAAESCQHGRAEIQFTLEEAGTAPDYKTEHAAGMDICCAEAFELQPSERKLVSTGLRIALPDGFEAQVRPRSGLALKHGISMVNTPGTVDADYRGEILVLLINLGQNPVEFKKGERIAQMVIASVVRANLVRVDHLPQSVRGEGGFGSTGV
jgi:dUTP pyrophosphatase